MLLLALAHPGPLEFVKNLGGSTRTGGESHKKAWVWTFSGLTFWEIGQIPKKREGGIASLAPLSNGPAYPNCDTFYQCPPTTPPKMHAHAIGLS